MSMRMNFMLTVAFVFLLSAGYSLAAELEAFQFLKISPQEQKAVVKLPEGELQMVGIGAVIAGDARIVEIVEGRVVLEQPGEAGDETVIVRLDGKQQRIERISKRGEKPPETTAPVKERDPEERGKSGSQ
ncbi:MAG: hypothetical protein A2091_10105 [Desulfuromonadales bacterium GWD2_61_12]|nr:MAG: hypothetical protein A2091_10105 [Desulfuromonadales bacterium GWD2_61_12]